jgi:pimeloyl-ACP methyl ester carboxylesterase
MTGRIKVRVRGERIRIAYDTWGTGRPVVLLHGMGSWRRIWAGVDVTGYRFWALDLPGFGESDLPRRRQALPDYCEAVRGALSSLGVESPVVVGHSFGAMVAVASVASGLNAAGLLLVAPAGFIPPRHALEPTPWVCLNRLLIWVTALDWFGERMAAGLGLSPDRLDGTTRRELRQGWRRAREMARMGRFYTYPGMAQDVRALMSRGLSVRILHGSRDPLFPREDLAPVLSGIPVEWLPEVGHVPMLQKPDAFRTWFAEALRALYPGESPA